MGDGRRRIKRQNVLHYQAKEESSPATREYGSHVQRARKVEQLKSSRACLKMSVPWNLPSSLTR